MHFQIRTLEHDYQVVTFQRCFENAPFGTISASIYLGYFYFLTANLATVYLYPTVYRIQHFHQVTQDHLCSQSPFHTLLDNDAQVINNC